MITERQTFALALLHIPGVGRVTAGRLLSRFEGLEELREYPREQILHRIKGARNGEQLVNNLFDDDFLDEHLAYAREQLDTLTERQIEVLTLGGNHWPTGFDEIESSKRPVVLYAYGNTANLTTGGVSFFGRAPLEEESFERAEDLVSHASGRDVTVIGGVATGFDNVVQKLATRSQHTHPSVMIANCGLAKIPSGLRSTAGKAVQSGGLMISSFPMAHGPYDHDDYERALLQAAVSEVCVFVQPRPDTPEWRAMQWALTHGRATYVLPDTEHDPPPGATIVADRTLFDEITSNSHH